MYQDSFVFVVRFRCLDFAVIVENTGFPTIEFVTLLLTWTFYWIVLQAIYKTSVFVKAYLLISKVKRKAAWLPSNFG